MISNQTKFRPVYGTESKILNLDHHEGWVYVASDTGKIFIDANNSRKQIGGSGGSGGGGGSADIVWADADEDKNTLKADPNDTSGNDSMYLLALQAVESGSLPNVDALIVNSDGRFFRVLDNAMDEDGFFSVELIAVSGGGSGGGGGGTSTADLTLTIDSSTLATGATLIQGQDYMVKVMGTSTKDPSVSLRFEITGANNYTWSRNFIAPSGEWYELNTNFLPENEDITLKVTVSSDNTEMRRLPSRTVSQIRVIPMTISKGNSLNAAAIMSGSAMVPYFLGGDPELVETLHVFIDGNEAYDLSQSVSPSNSERSVRIPAQSHGTHIIELNVSTEINGVLMTSDSITYELAWADPNEQDPIIWIEDYATTVIQYENFSINYQVYDPAVSGGGKDDYFSVNIYKRGALISEITRKYVAGSWLTLDLTESYDLGNNSYTISCGTVSKNIEFYVTDEGSRDLNIDQEERLVFSFSATGRSNNEISVNRPVWRSGDRYGATFTGFNWYSNGWLNDDDGNGSYLSVTNGASVSIPFLNYSSDPAELFNFNQNLGYTFELRFRIKNVQEYSTLVSTIPYYYIIDAETGNKSSEGVSIYDIKENGYQIAVDDDGNWLMDEEHSVKVIKKDVGVALRIVGSGDNWCGLCVGTQEAFLKTPEGVTSVRYKEDEIINFSVVISNTDKLASIYLNGILSGSIRLGNNSSFTMGSEIEINSDYADIDIYKMRFFNTALTMPSVIHNYISDKHDLTLYDQNQLTKDNGPTLLSYKKLIDYNAQMLEEGKIDQLSMPYAVFEIIDNQTGMIDPNKGVHTLDDDKLPWMKGNNRYCKITFVNPTLDALYNKGDIDAATYEKHSPSYVAIGADINVQGTSSQGYPRRNYKTKHKSASKKKDANDTKHSDWGWNFTNEKFMQDTGKTSLSKWYQDNPNYGTNKWTWKIDYMESSGSYNTGFANLVGNNIYDKHPLSYYNIPGINMEGLRTSVYGFPVLVFHKHSKPSDLEKIGGKLEDEIYEYIGRYNLNQDKGSDELFGFSLEKEQPYVYAPWDEENDDGNIVHHDHPYIADVAECWEMTDNQGTWTSFTYPQSAQEAHFSTYTVDSYDAETGELKDNPRLEVIRHFECRYHKEADYIEKVASDENPYDLAGVNEEIAKLGISEENAAKRAKWERINTIPKMNQFIVDKWANWERFVTWVDSTDTTKADATRDLAAPVEYQVAKAPADMTGVTLRTEAGFTYATFTKDTAAYRLQKFISEFEDHLNLEYCAVYFVMTELLLCYDSRGKNMMMASYGPMRQGGDYIWFPIFYDIDTQLGLNNIGATLWDYDTDATLEQTFSTPSSVLWVNFLAGFEDFIKQKYRTLRASSRLTYENIEGAYLCSPNVFDSYAMKGLRPIIAIGLDSYYKYVAPSKTGYYNTSGELKMDNNSYAYAVNGDRILSRELLLRNRLNYMDSCWVAGDYVTAALEQKSIVLRGNANNMSTSDKYLDSAILNELPGNAWQGEELAPYPVQYYDGTPEFEITPFLKQYVVAYNDNQINGAPVKYDGSTPVKTYVSDSVLDGYKKTPGYPEQIIKVPGPDYISSLGDLSTKYLSRLIVPQGKRLLYLDVGSDAPEYYNDLLGAGAGSSEGQFNINDAATVIDDTGHENPNPDRKALLRRINLTNIRNLSVALDITGSNKIREFRALGTKLPYVSFADGTPLDTIHLPKTVTRINLIEARNLTKILTSKPVVFGQPKSSYTGLYIEGVTDLDLVNGPDPSTILLSQLDIRGGVLGYDSYILMMNMLELRKLNQQPKTIGARINLEDVDWSPYKVVEAGTPYSSTTTYYRLTDHSTFIRYQLPASGAAEEWTNLTLNEKIYTYQEDSKSELIEDLSFLDDFIADYQRASTSTIPGDVSYYTNLNNSIGYPNLTGAIYVANANGNAIEEADITEKYGQIWPKLKIYAQNVEEAYIAKFLQRLDTGKDKEIDVKRAVKGNDVHPTKTNKQPTRQNYVFRGWTLSTNPNDMTVSEDDVARLISEGRILVSQEDFNNLTFDDSGNDVYTFYAVFSIQEFTIHFKDALGDYEYTSYKAPYGSSLYEPNGYFTTDESDLSEVERYKFLGWTRDSADWLAVNAKAAKTLKLNQIVSQNTDQTFYAVYIKENCLENPTDEKYFNFIALKEGAIDAEGHYATYAYKDDYDSTYDVREGWAISPKVNMSGKITLPASHVDPATGRELPVVKIAAAAFRGIMDRAPTPEEVAKYPELQYVDTMNIPGPGYGITHIYWYGDTSQFRAIEAEAFQFAGNWDGFATPELDIVNVNRQYGVNIFKYFDMPLNTRQIGNSAFSMCYVLQPIDFSETKIAKIEQSGFYDAFTCNEQTYDILHFPGCLTYIGAEAFEAIFFNDRVISTINVLQFGGEGDASNLSYIGDYAFAMATNVHVSNCYMYLREGADETIYDGLQWGFYGSLSGGSGIPVNFSKMNP